MHQPSNVISLLRAQWQQQAEKNSKGKIIPNYDNAMLALKGDPDIRDVFAYDQMLRTVVLTHEIAEIRTCQRRVTEVDVCNLLGWMQQHGMPYMRLDIVRSALNTRAHENAFHPLIDYLMSVQWDGVPRLATWLTVYLGAELSQYNENIGRMFLVSMVARVIRPGCQADHMMVLEGPQGILKSSACRVLGGQWFSDHLPDIHASGRDVSQHLKDKWLIEVPEMHAMSRADATLLKSFISRTVEQYRPSYGRLEVEEPRHCVFVGTTNMDTYLKDPTGGRRFWPVKTGVTARIELSLLEENRDQLFAEAVDAYGNHDPWWPDAQLERELIKPEQSARFVGDIWEDQIEEYLHGKTSTTVADIARNKLGFVDKELRGDVRSRIFSVLRDLGWEAKRSGRRRWWEPQ